MKFRLTYEGELRATQRDPPEGAPNGLAEHKHKIRRVFHEQLKYLWKTDRFLSEYRIAPDNPNLGEQPVFAANTMYARWARDQDKLQPLVEVVAGRHQQLGYRFIPLVPKYFHLLCSLHVLFLRRDVPGRAIQAGDIDNRIKTLIDTLRLPRSPNELVAGDQCPGKDEDPFFCLLEDDDQVSDFSVETDTLLIPPCSTDEDRHVKVVVTVRVRPFFATPFNLSFV